MINPSWTNIRQNKLYKTEGIINTNDTLGILQTLYIQALEKTNPRQTNIRQNKGHRHRA